MRIHGPQCHFVNRLNFPDGYEQGLGYAFSCCSTVARCCDMGSFEGGGLAGGGTRLSRSSIIPSPDKPPHYLLTQRIPGPQTRRVWWNPGLAVPSELTFRVYTRGIAPCLWLAASSDGISARAETKTHPSHFLEQEIAKLPGHLTHPVP